MHLRSAFQSAKQENRRFGRAGQMQDFRTRPLRQTASSFADVVAQLRFHPRSPVRARQNNGVAIRIAQPAFPMIRPAVAAWWVVVAWHHDLGIHLACSRHRVVKVINFEPKQHAVTIRFVIRIADRFVIVVDLEAVQLHNEHAVDRASYSLPRFSDIGQLNRSHRLEFYSLLASFQGMNSSRLIAE